MLRCTGECEATGEYALTLARFWGIGCSLAVPLNKALPRLGSTAWPGGSPALDLLFYACLTSLKVPKPCHIIVAPPDVMRAAAPFRCRLCPLSPSSTGARLSSLLFFVPAFRSCSATVFLEDVISSGASPLFVPEPGLPHVSLCSVLLAPCLPAGTTEPPTLAHLSARCCSIPSTPTEHPISFPGETP